MHRLVRKVEPSRLRVRLSSSSSRCSSSASRTQQQRHLSSSSCLNASTHSTTPCNPPRTTPTSACAIHRYYSSTSTRAFSSSVPSSKNSSEFVTLLSSIKPGITETQLAAVIVRLIDTTHDQNERARLESLVSLYALGIDKKTLHNEVEKCLKMTELELEQFSQVEKGVEHMVEEMDLLGSSSESQVVKTSTSEPVLLEVLGQAEETVASLDESSEDVLARAIVSIVRATANAGSSGYGRQGEKLEKEKERTWELVNLFVKAARNAELASEGVITEPLFGSVSQEETDTGAWGLGKLVDYSEREVHDEDKLERLSSQLDQLLQASSSSSTVEFDFGDPTVVEPAESGDGKVVEDEEASQRREGRQRIKDIVKEFTNDEGVLDSEVAEALRAFGFRSPNSAAPSKKSDFQETEASPEFSFAQAMAETTRQSSEADDLDTGALASGKKNEAQPFETFPNLMTPDPLMDSRDVRDFPPDKESPYHNRVVVRNHASIFHEQMVSDGADLTSDAVIDSWKPEETDEVEEEQQSSVNTNVPLGNKALNELYRFPIFSRRVTQQTGKGKIHRIYSLVIVGNGDGLVGYGEGKDEDSSRAEAKAFSEAVRSMDWVERFEKRTVWTEMETKLGATRLILRPRPVGFGLRCNPYLHQVLKAAGIKDISAKVWGSRNPLNVIKAAFRMLQAGNAPLAMGDGVGGKGRKLNKGSGMRGKGEVERERGRRLVNLRK